MINELTDLFPVLLKVYATVLSVALVFRTLSISRIRLPLCSFIKREGINQISFALCFVKTGLAIC